MPAAVVQGPDELGQIVGGVHVEHEAGISSDPVRDARALGRRHVAREAARAEARLDGVRRREHQRVRAGPWRSGTITSRSVLAARSGPPPRRAARSGVSPGTSSTRSKPAASA